MKGTVYIQYKIVHVRWCMRSTHEAARAQIVELFMLQKRQVAGLEKALAVSERSIARVKKVEKKTLKRKSLKNLWESSRASDAASA